VLPATVPPFKGPYTPSAWMIRGQTQHAFVVDDASLVIVLAT